MRKIFSFLLLTSFVFVAVALGEQIAQEGASCKHCGMNRTTFAHSRMLVNYANGSKSAICSLHCAAVELANTIDQMPVDLRVADFYTRELVDAERAVWVLGGNRKGVMTAQPKWAFATRAAAQRFVKENGGKIVSFDDAIKAAYLDMYQDTRMIREMRELKRAGTHAVGHAH